MSTRNIDPAWLEQPVLLATRQSALALWQANHIRDRLRETWGKGLQVELVKVITEGDRILDRPLNLVGGKGLFVKGIEDKLLAQEVDLAVHSMKDLPGNLPPGLTITCTPEREDPRDALLGPEGGKLAKLPAGTRLGTSSLRRSALARRLNGGLKIVPLRGNVPTRIEKMKAGECDAILLAASGLKRLGLDDQIVEHLEVERFCPAACQGILAIEIREDDVRMKALLQPLHHAVTGIVADAERGFLRRLDGGCQVPMGCHATVRSDDIVTVSGMVIDPSGRPCFIATKVGHPNDADAVGRELAETLLRLGANRILESISHSVPE